MNIVSKLLLAAAGFLGLGVASGNADEIIRGFRFPEKVAGQRVGAKRDYEKDNPGYGWSIEYLGKFAANVYVYDLKKRSLPDGIKSKPAQDHFAETCKEVFLLKDNVNVKVLISSETLDLGGLSWLHASFSYTLYGDKVISRLFLTVHKGHFLKVRVTRRASAEPDQDKLVQSFVEELSRTLK